MRLKQERFIPDEIHKEYIKAYEIFPGLQAFKVMYQKDGLIEKRKKSNELEINFCVGGRFECEFTERDIGILKPGDMSVSMFDGKNGVESYSRFPMGFYEGLSILVDCDRATEWLRRFSGDFAVDVNMLKNKLLANHWYQAGEAGLRCEHVFREIYDGIDHEPQRFMQLKVIELFMLMERFAPSRRRDVYYPRGQVALIKHIRDHIITDGSYYSSVEQLAKDHDLSAPQLQKLFRDVFGMPIYRYLKEYRLERAAVDLIGTETSIMDLAQNAGFSNASKFSQSFKKRYGMTPSQYRKLNKYKH